MKKILMIASVASMIDQFNMSNIDILKKQGYEVHVAANFEKGSTCSNQRIEEFKKELTELNVNYHHVDFSRKITNVSKNVKAYKLIKKLMLRNKYEFVHCQSPIGGFCGRIAAKNTNTPVIYTAHGFHFFRGAPLKNWLLYYPVEKYLAKYTDCLITTNNEDYNRVKNSFKAKTIKYVNGVGVDLNNFKPQNSEIKKTLREKYGYNQNDFIVFFAGELTYRKHQDLLIDVISLLKDKIPNIKLLLAGVGDQKEKYQDQAKRLGVEEIVHFIGFRRDIANILTLSDIAVSSSRQEGLPVNVMMAMSIGLPLIATDCRGNCDLVSSGENGYLVGVDDKEEFANKIEIIYASKELKDKFSQNNLKFIKNYSLENIRLQMEKIYIEFADEFIEKKIKK